MENPTPTIQRRRRSDRYVQEDAAASVVTEAPATPSAEASPSAYQRTPRSSRAAAAPAPQAVPQPRALQHSVPSAPPLFDEAPSAMARPKRPAPAPARKKPAYRMPVWITASIIGLLVGILALTAAQNMMSAYIYQQQQARADAYQAIVDEHPMYYMDLIAQYAEEYNLRPAFVTAIILNESSFRTDAESGVGARGLMQLMPDTAEWIAGKLDMENYHFDRMYDAESNIRFGCWYLNYLSKLFRGDPVAVACAYHAGQSTVASWLSNESISADGINLPLENLPDGPTKTYAGRVTEDYAIYDALYFHVFNQTGEGSSADAGLSVSDAVSARR